MGVLGAFLDFLGCPRVGLKCPMIRLATMFTFIVIMPVFRLLIGVEYRICSILQRELVVGSHV